MSKKVFVLSVQPDPDGPTFGRVFDPVQFQNSQDYAHGHIGQVVKDLLVAGAGAQVAGFLATVTDGLNVSVARGSVVDANGVSYDTVSDDPTVVAMAAAHPALARIDLIYATLEIDAEAASEFLPFRQLRTQAELESGADPFVPTQFNQPTELHTKATIAVRTGTPGFAPVAPAAGAGEAPLWTVHVAAAQTVLGGGDLTDVRVLMRSLYQSQVEIAVLQALVNQAVAQGDLQELVQDFVGAFLAAGTGITVTYNDAGNIESIALDLSYLTEKTQDIVGAFLAAGTGITATYNDAGNVESIGVDTGYLTEAVQDIVGTFLAAGTGITATYNDAGNVESVAVDTSYLTEAVQDIVGAFLGSPDSSLTVVYNDSGNIETIVLLAAYKTLLDGATSAATASTLVKRDGNGDFAMRNLSAVSLATSGHSTMGSPVSTATLLDIKSVDDTATPVVGFRKQNSNETTPTALQLTGNPNDLNPNRNGILDIVDSNPGAVGAIATALGNLATLRGSSTTGERLAFRVQSIGDTYVARDLQVIGAVSKGSGTFHIDHPLDPSNKDLIHGFIEAPRHDLIYRGRSDLVDGQAEVSIDEASGMTAGTFAALTQNPQGEAWNESSDENNFDLVRLWKIEGGTAFIKSNNPNANFTVGWIVIAERRDPFIKAIGGTDEDGRLIVEVEKPVGDALLLEPTTEIRRAEVAAPNTTVEKVVDALVGTKGYPRHAHTVGQGAVPTRLVTIETQDQEGNPYVAP